jgi:hypothetical protein
MTDFITEEGRHAGRISGLREALDIVVGVEWHDGTPAYYLDNWIQQALNARIRSLSPKEKE